MGDHHDLMFLSGDVHYDFASSSGLTYWLGGGPALVHDNPEFGDSRTDLGLNVLGGLGGSGGTRPFVQIRGTMADQSYVGIAGGLRF